MSFLSFFKKSPKVHAYNDNNEIPKDIENYIKKNDIPYKYDIGDIVKVKKPTDFNDIEEVRGLHEIEGKIIERYDDELINLYLIQFKYNKSYEYDEDEIISKIPTYISQVQKIKPVQLYKVSDKDNSKVFIAEGGKKKTKKQRKTKKQKKQKKQKRKTKKVRS